MRTVALSLLVFILSTTGTAQYLTENTNPNEVTTWYEEGERAYRAGDHAMAVVWYTRVIDRDPGHLNAHLQRGFCHSLMKDHVKAVADFSAVIASKDDHIWAYTSRGSSYSKLGEHDLAIADFNKVLTLDPKNEEAYNNRGWARKATGDQAGACKDWNTSKRMGNAEAKIILTNNRCK
ncbi:MAG TPA: tetratricopeptide repeat protein [Flavobacteriales bacterium]|nr:tetratricopeptide repeat protein [Flavobacteriales bacterium]